MNYYGFVGDKVEDLATLRALKITDERRRVEYGLTTRMIEFRVKKGLQAVGTDDILVEFYATSGMSLKEREIKAEINDYLVSTLVVDGHDPEDQNQLADFDSPAYFFATIVYKLRNEQLDKILAADVCSENFSLIISKFLEKNIDFAYIIGKQLAQSEDTTIVKKVKELGIYVESEKEQAEDSKPEKLEKKILDSKWCPSPAAILVLLFAFVVGLYFSQDSIGAYLSEVRNRV